MLLATFTIFHVLISIVAIITGVYVVAGMLLEKPREQWTGVFLATTAVTSATGFLFPVHHFMPSHGVGLVSLLMLSAASFARYRRHLSGLWRPAFVITVALALYLNVFVFIIQAFTKVPALKSMAPTQSELPFKVTQLSVLGLFSVITVFALIRFRKAQPVGVQTPASQ